MRFNHLIIKTILFFIILVFLDQLSKYLIRQVGGFYVCNKGVAFGIQVSESLLILTAIILLGVLTHILRKKYFMHNTLCITLILAGAFSNIIDRLIFGYVIDFIDLKFWPVFNLADVFITAGAVLLLAKYWKS